jgi:hypothetical protein
LDGEVLALQSRDYHGDFYYLTNASSQIRNHPYLSGGPTSLSNNFVDNLTPTALSYSGVTPGTAIVTTKHICLATKNKLLVHGLSSTSENIFELH